jgi:hypothetical protein
MLQRLVFLFVAVYPMLTAAQGRWEHATNIGQQPSSDPLLLQCAYQTVGGYRFSTTSRGVCTFSVEVSPETGKVRAPGNVAANSQSRSEPATLLGQQPSGDPMWQKCSYQTLGGYRFSITHRGVCPFSLEVNPESARVTQPNTVDVTNEGGVGYWESATKTGQEQAIDGLLWRCSYETLGGYRFTTTSRNICKFSVQVNPATRAVR